jgi:serine phosphatase RsbU (regulator of sigma subunit)
MKRFAEQMEILGQAMVKAGREHSLRISLSSTGTPSFTPLDKDITADLEGRDRLWAFLHEAGVRAIELEPRLESNQIVDVFQVLFASRRHLHRCAAGHSTHGLVAALQSPDGLAFACTVTRLNEGVLTVSYSYCRTRLSRLVTWFEKRHPRLADHRALFWAAPRYGLLMGVMVILPFALYMLSGTRLALLAATTASALIVFGFSHLFFMTIGGLVYDNEEQGHQLQRAHAQLGLYAERIQQDLKRARRVQQQLLPDLKHMPVPARLEWAARFLPESEVGGDYFDAAALDSERVAIVFADVSGHGMSAALVTTIIKMAFLDWVETDGDLRRFLEELNLRLYRLTPQESFAAVFACVLDTRTGQLTYKNCGHNPQPYLIRSGGSVIERLDQAADILLGIQEPLDEPVAALTLKPGDALIFASDGLTESFNNADEMFGTDRMEQVLAEYRDSGLNTLVDRTIGAVDAFSTGAHVHDDRTILAVRFRQHRVELLPTLMTREETQQ